MNEIIGMIVGIVVIIGAVGGLMIFSFLAGARVYRAGRENYPVNVVEFPQPKEAEKEKGKGKPEEEWDNG